MWDSVAGGSVLEAIWHASGMLERHGVPRGCVGEPGRGGEPRRLVGVAYAEVAE